MICERPYMPPLQFRGPGAVCHACDGRAFRRWFDTDIGWVYLPCAACLSVATAGVFVVRIATARFTHELCFHTSDLDRASRRAGRAAMHVAGRRCMGHEPLRVEVVYKPLDPTHARNEERVEAIAVPSRTRAAT